jgi:hypothetical protein
VVTVFTYSYHTRYDSIQWQPEEVEWGDFIPYCVVKQSVERMKRLGTWPGRIQEQTDSNLLRSRNSEIHFKVPTTCTSNASSSWDYVPDGLLVWAFWLDYLI